MARLYHRLADLLLALNPETDDDAAPSLEFGRSYFLEHGALPPEEPMAGPTVVPTMEAFMLVVAKVLNIPGFCSAGGPPTQPPECSLCERFIPSMQCQKCSRVVCHTQCWADFFSDCIHRVADYI
jgi:hypothetical protein